MGARIKIEHTAVSAVMATNFQNPNAVSASQPAAPNLKFEREDWTSFRTIEGLMQKAGVAKVKLGVWS